MPDPISPGRMAFLHAIEAGPWDDQLARDIYADWLDERGEHEEAMRQRAYVAARRRLTEFAEKHAETIWPDGQAWRPGVDPVGRRTLTYEEIVATAASYVEAYNRSYHYAYFPPSAIQMSDADLGFVGLELRRQFWTDWSTVTGAPVPFFDWLDDNSYKLGNPFVCGC
jgi:uncharacterized protein (TIGR02996 family)